MSNKSSEQVDVSFFIYALLSVKFSGLKMCECKRNYNYEVWNDIDDNIDE